MAYRSDVRIVMSNNGYEEFKKYVKEHIDNYRKNNLKEGTIAYESDYDYNLLNNTDIFKYSNDKEQVYIGWDCLKWYDGYEDVDAIMDSLDKLDENNYGYYFSRIGENIEDIEEVFHDLTEKDNSKHLYFPDIVRYFDNQKFEETNKNVEQLLENINSKKIYIIQSNFISEDEVSNEIIGVTVSKKKAEEIFNGEINKIKCDYDFNSLDVKDSNKTSNLEEEQWYFDKTDDNFNLFLNGRYNTNSCSITIKEYDLEKVLELDKNNKSREER